MVLTKWDMLAAVAILAILAACVYSHYKAASPDLTGANTLDIKKLIQRVKQELVQTEQERLTQNQPALFVLKDFTLEIKFVVTEERTETGEIQYEVITVGGEQNYSNEKVQTITINMTAAPPIHEDAGPSTPAP